ncbi:MAG: YIP1 family protein [Myxococcota bacterium]
MDASPWSPPAESAPVPEVDDDDVVPFLDIWVRPGATMRFLLRTNPARGVLGIALLHGVVSMNSDGLGIGPELLMRGLLGPVVGVLMVVLSGLLMMGIGSMFDGRGSFVDCMSAIAWGGLPSTMARFAALGLVWFAPWLGEAGVWALVATVPVLVIGWSWSFLWQVVTVAEAHRFGWFEAAVTVSVPWLGMLGCFGMLMVAAFSMAA